MKTKLYVKECLKRYFEEGERCGLGNGVLAAERNMTFYDGCGIDLKYASEKNSAGRRIRVIVPLSPRVIQDTDPLDPTQQLDFSVDDKRFCQFFFNGEDNSIGCSLNFQDGTAQIVVASNDDTKSHYIERVLKRRRGYGRIEELVRQFAKDYKKS